MTGNPAHSIDWSRFDAACTASLRAMDAWTEIADRLGTTHLDTLRLRSAYVARRDTETAEWVRLRDQILGRTSIVQTTDDGSIPSIPSIPSIKALDVPPEKSA